MRVVFFGLPMAALALLHDGHDVVIAAIPRAGAPGVRRLRRRLGEARVFVKTNFDDPAFADRLAKARPDLVVSWFFTHRIPSEVIASARFGGFGVHPSLLPRHRGPDPCFWAIERGAVETGVTAHRLADEYDTGDILAVRPLLIDPSWDGWALARALDRPSMSLLRETASQFETGTPPVQWKQDEAKASYAPTPDEALLEIDFRSSVLAVLRRIRAAAPYPGAWTFIGEEAVIITRAHPTVYPKGLLPGEASIFDGLAVVAAADGGIALDGGRIVLEDDREVIASAADFARLVVAART
ncbi:MAG: hypothetical protein NVSMB1_07420 [Polyangiales bacterium]